MGQGRAPWGWGGPVGAAAGHRALGSVHGLLLRLAPCGTQPGEGGASPFPSEPGGGLPWFSSTPSHTHTHTLQAPTHTHTHKHCTHLYIHIYRHTYATYTHTYYTLNTLAAHSSFSLSPCGPRSLTCRSPRPLTKPRPRTSWCTRSIFLNTKHQILKILSSRCITKLF